MILNDAEKMLVRDLRMNPAFGGICEKLQAERRVQKWKKDGDETAKHNQWVYHSGRADGIDFCLTVLGYFNE